MSNIETKPQTAALQSPAAKAPAAALVAQATVDVREAILACG